MKIRLIVIKPLVFKSTVRWLGVINVCLVAIILFVAGLFVFSNHEEVMPSISVSPEKKELPKSSFADTEEFFHEIGESLFALKWVAPQMQLPDLRNEFQFYGKNTRPDSLPGKACFHLSLKGSHEHTLVRENERIYVVYYGNYSPQITQESPSREPLTTSNRPLWGDVPASKESFSQSTAYIFSPDNQPTPLWLEISSLGENAVAVQVSMLDEKGAIVTSPTDLRSFTLQLQDFPKSQVIGWDLGGYRVDTTLLVRQKARWIGPDLFLEQHGGDTFGYTMGRERVDFLDGQIPYSCFVQEGDFLVWKESRWEVANNLHETQNLPLMIVKKIDEKIMSFELWDPDGKGKLHLSLIHARDHNSTPNIAQEFKFVGAKTWAQFIVECRNGGRMTLKPNDWLVFTQDGWIKLDTPDQIDAFVDQDISGPLFILDSMAKQNGRQVLLGHLFNASRTEVTPVELAASSNTSLANFYRRIPMTPPIKPQNMETEGRER